MTHTTKIERYQGSLRDLAEDVGNLQYDALSEFLDELSDKISRDQKKDSERGRSILAGHLWMVVSHLDKAKSASDQAWEICRKYM